MTQPEHAPSYRRLSGRPPAAYGAFGLSIRSDLPLDLPAGGGARADVRVVWQPDLRRRGGRTIARLALPDLAEFVVDECADGSFEIAFEDLALFRWDPATSVLSAAAPDARTAAVLVSGTVLATVLELSGQWTLHGSAVEWRDRAVVFTAGSGGGKSTLAAWCTLAGAKLVADDVVVLTGHAGGIRCLRGEGRIRLRSTASELAALLGPAEVSSDGRLLVRPAMASSLSLPVAALVSVYPTFDGGGDGDGGRVERLGPAAAVECVLSAARVAGWSERDVLSRRLEHAAEVVSGTAVLAARVPWGPPFDAATPAALLDDLLRA
ncbi:MAG TPA: hypothetical protein VM933_00045 [Acidimicrobiales bacterium]|nr:hypothetical protein [Acidimicrobiales bacterium]